MKTPIRIVCCWWLFLLFSACATTPPESGSAVESSATSPVGAAGRPLGEKTQEPQPHLRETVGQSSKSVILINYFGSINEVNIGFLIKTILSEVAAGETNFQININSTGGDPGYGVVAYNTLKNLPITITTYNVNQVESAAVYLYCLGAQRYAHPRAIFTVHSVKWSLTGYSPNKLVGIAKKIDAQQARIVDIFTQCMRIEKGQIERYLFGDDDWYIEAQEALRKGLIHKVTVENIAPKKVYLIADGYKG